VSISRRRYPYAPPPGRQAFEVRARVLRPPDERERAIEIVFVEGRRVDVLDAECRESLGVDFRAWRSGLLKSSGTSAM
jgi:hypothetical protein